MINFVVEDGTGLASATSYVSTEEADDIAVLNIHNADTWLALPLDKKRNLLMYATKSLDVRATWGGEPTSTTQALGWPRKNVVDQYKNTLASNVVPFNVRMAVVEFAKWTLTTDRIGTDRPENALAEVKLDTLTLKFADPTNFALDQFKVPDFVDDLLKGLGRVRSSRRKITFGKAVRT